MTEYEHLTPIVAQVLKIEDITSGGAKDRFLTRYRGKLYGDSISAYDKLAASLYQHDVTPLFRIEDGKDTVLLLEGTIKSRPSNPVINLLLIGLTFVSMVFAGTMFAYSGPIPSDIPGFIITIINNLALGLPFAISLMAILLAHEFGHYLAAKYHKTKVTLPYFIPLPLGFGTLGAFIRLKEPPKNKRILLDIGIAGPLAGLIVAIPIVILGLSLSTVEVINLAPGQGIQIEGNSVLYLLSKYLVFGKLLPAPVSYEINPILYWIRYIFTGLPIPQGGLDVIISPIAWAGWAGLLVTAFNLIPAGQLDGGHLIYVLMDKKAKYLYPIVLVVLLVLGFRWSGWWIWALLIFILGRVYAEPLDQITQLNPQRKYLAIFGLIIFFLVFTPVPLILYFAGG